MEYIQLEWFHDVAEDPCIIYSEINGQRYEVRKIAAFKDGTYMKCNEEMINSQIELADVPFPVNLEEINQDKQFYAKYISKEEFQEKWENC